MQILPKNKLSRKTKIPLIIIPMRPFEKCALNIVGPLTVTNENKYILMFQDNLTKFSKAILLTN